jgi:hypothetical protein
MAHQDALDAGLEAWTGSFGPYDLMMRLQSAGVPAGVCQTAADRCDNDPQLRHLGWLTELTGTRIGRWPLAELPVRMSRTPPYLGGRPNRAAPLYGEDNAAILGELLGMSEEEVAELTDQGVLSTRPIPPTAGPRPGVDCRTVNPGRPSPIGYEILYDFLLTSFLFQRPDPRREPAGGKRARSDNSKRVREVVRHPTGSDRQRWLSAHGG